MFLHEILETGPIVYGVVIQGSNYFTHVFAVTRNGQRLEYYEISHVSYQMYKKKAHKDLPSDMDIEHGLDVIVEAAQEWYTDIISEGVDHG